MGEIRNAHESLFGIARRNRELCRVGSRRENDIKMDLKERDCEEV
jgi:hypothetical protein